MTEAGPAPISFRVFATQYQPSTPGSVEVAVPDKCVKFAALQNSSALGQFGCPSGYPLGLDYRVDVSRDSGQSARLPVRDVGPWNIDDNYWDAASGTPRPRRRFTDLPQGTPESQAAFYQKYNTLPNCLNLDGTASGHAGGADAQGRCVLNPAGIDISVPAAAQLGLQAGQNDWVNVTFRWEADPATLTNDPDDVRTPRVGVINGCSAAFVKGGPLTSYFRQQLNCGDAKSLTLGGSRVGVINSCGAGYVKDGALSGPFNQMVGCADAGALVVSPDRVGVINGCGAFYVKEGGLSGPFHQQTACGDAKAIAVTNDRLAVINGCGALYVKEGALGGPFNQQTACGDATATALAGNRVGVINGCGAAYVKEGPLNQPFRVQVNCGDAKSLSLSSF